MLAGIQVHAFGADAELGGAARRHHPLHLDHHLGLENENASFLAYIRNPADRRRPIGQNGVQFTWSQYRATACVGRNWKLGNHSHGETTPGGSTQ